MKLAWIFATTALSLRGLMSRTPKKEIGYVQSSLIGINLTCWIECKACTRNVKSLRVSMGWQNDDVRRTSTSKPDMEN